MQEGSEGEKAGFWRTVYNRLGLKGLEYPAPQYAQTLPYLLGVLSLATFVILIVTGIYLSQFYDPNQITSNQSVQYLILQVPFGNFIEP